VNAVSAGPLKTLASSAVGEFDKMLELYTTFSPMRRNITADEVGKTGMFLLSDLASGITGETLHVDAGYHIMGGPSNSTEAGRRRLFRNEPLPSGRGRVRGE
jgi:enoyl-[acyl-carrier protein] reductase I